MKNAVSIVENHALIHLTENESAQIDICDLDKVAAIDGRWTISANKHGHRYAVYQHDGSALLLHRFILDCQSKYEVDHVDGNGLNNLRSNIRIVTHAQNMQNRRIHKNNTSGARGVHWDKERNMWRVYVRLGGKVVFRKRFRNIEDAISASILARTQYMSHVADDHRVFSTI